MGRFAFKQFEVVDDRCAMKVGTDSVLLGSWTPVGGCRRVLDIGTGSGLLALMIAQRSPSASITAIEIDHGAVDDAVANIGRSPWADRIDIVEGDILATGVVAPPFDLIISNPPFFNETLKAPDSRRALARHGSGFDVVKLIEIAPTLLTPSGLLAFVAPAERKSQIELTAALARLDIVARCEVRQRPGRPVARHLYLLSPTPVAAPSLPRSITISDTDGYTEPYKSLTRDFYLHF